jgi:UDP-N-acetylmuramate dehydrogenase
MHDWRRDLGEAVAGCAAEVRFAESMAKHTTFRVGGLADAWVCVRDRHALERVLFLVCREVGVRTWLLGRGSNVLASDQGLRGVVVCLDGELAEVKGRGTELLCGAGAELDAVAEFAEKEGLVGAEFLAGIPGTVGGGLHSNAGAFGRSLGDVVASVTGLDPEGNEVMLAGTQLRREYRRPMIEQDLVVVEVTVRLEKGAVVQGSKGPGPASGPRDPATARPLTVAGIREQRWAKHPKEPSAGSFFRNPAAGDGSRVPAGRLIEECGLKGRSIGGAKVSEQHANFLVNTGRARFADVYELVQVIKATVERQTGILLEEEVQYLPGPGEVRDRGPRARGFGCSGSGPEHRHSWIRDSLFTRR